MAIGEMFASSFHLSRPGSAVAVLLGSWGFSGEVLPSAQAGVLSWGSQSGTGMQKERRRQGRRPPSPWGSPLPLISGGCKEARCGPSLAGDRDLHANSGRAPVRGRSTALTTIRQPCS